MAARLPAPRLAAAAHLVASLRQLEQRASNLAADLLGGEPFIALNHYPANDVIDAATGAQFYFHAHPADEPRQHRPGWTEIGHIHTFIRPHGPRGPIHHLIAIALDRFGRPVGLFTTNRWVTNEIMCPALPAIRYANRFHLTANTPAATCINAIFTLYANDIARLLRKRDATLQAHRRRNPTQDPLEARSLEILSAQPLHLNATLAALRASLP
ncbi:MAG TPA: hypothetical protein PK677_08330 [Acidiphilium sp.]|nr:MAG: hypothetical protein B7Z67_02735 [Acidiphilium sp. 21-60-14]OYV89652.1 MAG: hypothetical protein B7Z57_11525 [Acidiphilium sp. 37-60-79]OZB40847.1 MAG: hypothetical protein B7X48_03195 [Acidiphilium sp. 34-60-192]HQT88549.1 hypothetical protein [Acidiphilium sp.]HQU24382.1 hypothetical protein [Acidiphilium sp.]